MVRTLIVDDEPAARRLLRLLLQPHAGFIDVMGEAANGAEAVAFVNAYKPELLFLDIQMPGFSGFDVLKGLHFQPNVIFTTAYEEYALKAFETFSVDYLLKPIRQERLDAAIVKLKNFGKATESRPENLHEALQRFEQKKQVAFPVRLGDRILLFRYENISHFEAEDKYVFLFTTDGQKHITDQTLAMLEQKLPSNFLRVQKSYIVNKEKIREIHKHFNGRFVITMNDKTQRRLLSGLTYYERIKEAFGL